MTHAPSFERLPADSPVFIVGCPRSGTTLLRTMLHAHPRIAVPPETRFVIEAYKKRRSFGDLADPENRNRLALWITDRPQTRFRVLGLDRTAVVEQIHAAPPTLGSVLGVVLRAYSDKAGKPRWGDKRPSYYRFMDELDRLFPDAQFVHLIRDGRACVASLKRQPWFDDDPITCMATWLMAIDRARESGARLGPNRYHELRYEDLVADPEHEMRTLCKFLGEDYAPEMCEPEKIAHRVNPKHYTQREQIGQGIYTKAVEAWRDELEPWEIATFELVAGDRLASCGYDVSGVGGAPPTHQVRAVRRRYRGLRRRLALSRRIDALELIHADQPVDALLTAGQVEAAGRRVDRPVLRRVLRVVRPAAHLGRRAARLVSKARRRPAAGPGGVAGSAGSEIEMIDAMEG